MVWYRELFADDDPVRFDKYSESDKSRAEVDFVIEKLGLRPGMRVLDLCCGQGRHLLDLMRRGYEVVGVDLSEHQLSKCREAAADEGVQPQLVRADMREIAFDSEFDAVINMWTSFGYLESDDEDQKVLDAVSRALKPGGGLLVDSRNQVSLLSNFRLRDWFRNSRDEVVAVECRYDASAGRLEALEAAIRPDGSRWEQPHSVRLYTCPEFSRMLRAAGLELETVYGGFDGTEYTMDSKHMLVVARRGSNG